MEKKELKEVELRSEDLQEVMGKMPSWILRAGITVLFFVVNVAVTNEDLIRLMLPHLSYCHLLLFQSREDSIFV